VTGGKLGFAGSPVDVDALVPRQGAEIGETSMTLIEQEEMRGLCVVNGSAAIRRAADKFRAGRALAAAGLPVPDTVLLNSPDGVTSAAAAVGGWPVVLKPVRGRQGEGVYLAPDEASARGYLAGALDPSRGMVVQRFVPAEKRRDLRLLVLGDAVFAAASLRPDPGDFRSNFHLTGTVRGVVPEPEIAAAAVRAVAAVGLQMAGVDATIDARGRLFIFEVNYAPGFRGLEAATGLDVAGAMIAFVERRWVDRQPPAAE
jgi:ribosomal protein S6--L-glutamate ligase